MSRVAEQRLRQQSDTRGMLIFEMYEVMVYHVHLPNQCLGWSEKCGSLRRSSTPICWPVSQERFQCPLKKVIQLKVNLFLIVSL